MTTGKTIALTRWTFVGKVMSLLFNMLLRLIITFLPRIKCLLISWLYSPSAVILEPLKIVSHWAISNPKRWCCESAALKTPANLENSAVATGLEKVNFHSSPKERQCERMFRLLHNCTYLTRSQSNAQNSPSQASVVHGLWTSRCSSWI